MSVPWDIQQRLNVLDTQGFDLWGERNSGGRIKKLEMLVEDLQKRIQDLDRIVWSHRERAWVHAGRVPDLERGLNELAGIDNPVSPRTGRSLTTHGRVVTLEREIKQLKEGHNALYSPLHKELGRNVRLDDLLGLNPNPPKDTDGRREGSGRGWVRELQGRWPGVLG